jgi:hypothetical protein
LKFHLFSNSIHLELFLEDIGRVGRVKTFLEDVCGVPLKVQLLNAFHKKTIIPSSLERRWSLDECMSQKHSFVFKGGVKHY